MSKFRMNIEVVFSIAAILIMSACSTSPALPTPQKTTDYPPSHTILQAEVVFQVDIPSQTPELADVFIELLDEVTGLAIVPERHPLEPIGFNRYVTRIPIRIGSLVKYRYGREGNPSSIEYTASGEQVRYRLVKINGPMIVEDIVSAWTDLSYKGANGRISGTVQDVDGALPIANVLVTAGGNTTFTAADGSFLLEGLPSGTHRIVAYSLDGSYDVFQQGATVAAESLTPAAISLKKLPVVNVTFKVSVPVGTLKGIPVRLIGNLITLGNTFTDLSGGLSTVASRAPLMILQADGTYALTLELPAGADLRYKYSLGDGFWNGELNDNGSIRTRQLLVSDTSTEVNDSVLTWSTPGKAAVTFTVKVPPSTPESDSVFIQFNPYDWMEPIPMWPLGNNEWMYILNNPFDIVAQVSYRYCRNGLCEFAGEPANLAQARIFNPAKDPLSVQDEVKNWNNWNPPSSPTTIVAAEINKRGDGFTAGIELSPYYRPIIQSQINTAFGEIKNIGANWVFLTPTWTYTHQNPPVLENTPALNPSWQDILQITRWAQDKELKVAIFAQANMPNDHWWKTAARDQGWWQTWFEQYETFLVHFAILAQQTSASALILGEPGISPAVTGILPDGTSSAAPSNRTDLLKEAIKSIRSHYKGPIYWTLNYPGDTKAIPEFTADLDGFYILWNASLGSLQKDSEAALATSLNRLLNQDLLKIKEKYKKILLIGIDHASIKGAFKGCFEVNNMCLPFSRLNIPAQAAPLIDLDLQEQLAVYSVFLNVVNQNQWIDGIISRGFFPGAAFQDKTSSVYGKPAKDLLWYWFPRMTAKSN